MVERTNDATKRNGHSAFGEDIVRSSSLGQTLANNVVRDVLP